MYDLYFEIPYLSMLKSFVIFAAAIMLCFGILNCLKSKILIISTIVFAAFLSTAYYFGGFIPNAYLIAFAIFLSIAYVYLFMRKDILLIVNSTIFSFGVSYASFMLLSLVASVLIFLLKIYSYYLVVIVTLICQSVLTIFMLWRVKFKRIFEILNKKGIGFIGVGMSAIVFVLYIIVQDGIDNILTAGIFIVFVMITLCIAAWVIETRKNFMAAEKYHTTIDAFENRLNRLKESNYKTSVINHKYSERISALEDSITKLKSLSLNGNPDIEFSDELAGINERINKLSQDFDGEIQENFSLKLPKTNIYSIDAMLEYQQKQAQKHNINFSLNVIGNIEPLINTLINEGELETLIGDHIKDAIIAVNHTGKSFKSILVTIGEKDGCYYFSVTDTGIPFELDTLLKLGKEPVTTHADSGGMGLGFMTTFKILGKCGASLVISEHNSDLKTVAILFDDNNAYAILSYRADEIQAVCSDDNRIIVKDL